MSTSTPTIFAAVFTVAAAVYGTLQLLLHTTQDPKEPPPVPALVPFISSIIGLSRKKSRYYTELHERYDLPIYTIRLPGARLYVVNSTSLIPSVQRQYKTLAFPPIEAKLAMNVCGSSKTANDILNTNVNGDEGFWGYSITHYKALHPALFPGPGLDAMNRVMARKVTMSLSRIQKPKSTGLFDFIKQEITHATTESVYGEGNPFRDPVIVDSFWKFQEGLMNLLLGFLPSVVARESFLARERIAERFLAYFKAEMHEQGSALIKARYEHSVAHKVPVEDIARFEAAGAIAILTNTSPACFWLVYHLFSNPVALEDCRNELKAVISEDIITDEVGQQGKEVTIDMSQVKSSCPIMISSLQEALRLHTVGVSTRLVMEDHMLDGKFLLKKGGTVMIPGPVQHKNTSIWGDDVHSFNHRRFLPNEKRHNPIAFRGFGGGTTLCPGRHFASTEILAFTALLILRFDMAPADRYWKHVTTEKAGHWEVTPIPDQDIRVELIPRAGNGDQWKVLITDSDKLMPLSAEDVEPN
ncbi:putative 25-hydroxycholesterol 7-alpha-hydroxylase [Periconia macrospinosa]|uniref:Putative 25-hydroxycholesterol 7-alpha-hydroxylase n=1 Tax=Periconia macrospinosa TaxID=97972 RepID=A0A2V1DJ27_9PLEO|nr:putative 25-hydroxycholesterol 7-alpha-hydroxylase [Periconia macrospinosa]